MDQTAHRPDRRVRRSRSALLGAAVALVAERGTTNIPISDLAEAADVSRQLVYQQFGDRDALLTAAALDLVETGLLPEVTRGADPSDEHARALTAARHFARHRPFYRAMLTGPCAYRLNVALSGLLSPFNRELVRRLPGAPQAPDVLDDLTAFVTGGWAAVVNTWVVEGPEPLDPAAFADRLMEVFSVITGGALTEERDR
ncbi:TetR/AcrR family transcriptional regulator [Saccharothrix luteola]|uniref:TetR/AcrR family transcriptional regulator n=1 Tax=Saccharothrix luteola TaxID=2893018 RepID=UPI001E4AE6A8|nr:TetR/AcrR family transcriptional regulator [Saccharothrix luteola]MCC8246219.1 TetR/AcrR family transcriptional regulator [Saccharothrix luteola]